MCTQEISRVHTHTSLVCTQEISCARTGDLLCARATSPVRTQEISCVRTRDLLCAHKRSHIRYLMRARRRHLACTKEIFCVLTGDPLCAHRLWIASSIGRARGIFNGFISNILFSIYVWKSMSGRRFWRIRPVESVPRDPTQLFGRGFPHNFYIELVLSGFYVFWYSRSPVRHDSCVARTQ